MVVHGYARGLGFYDRDLILTANIPNGKRSKHSPIIQKQDRSRIPFIVPNIALGHDRANGVRVLIADGAPVGIGFEQFEVVFVEELHDRGFRFRHRKTPPSARKNVAIVS